MQEEETRAWLALSLVVRGRPDQWLAFVRGFGGALETVTASDQALAARGASPKAISTLRRAWTQTSTRVRDCCGRLGLRILALGSPAYPEMLARISDPPFVLFWRGAEPAALVPALAIVGARHCTDYGERTSFRIGKEAAAAGITVVSGLARGIDGAAHRGALETGRTLAVLAGGLDHIYPGEHRSLAERIAASGGGLVSEQPPGVRPLAWLFPFRNRIITGLSAATVIVEARRRSGSLASARHALDQGREVFSVPGPIDSPLSEGTNRLIAHGAAPLRGIADLAALDAFSKMLKRKARNTAASLDIRLRDLDPEEAVVVAAIRAGSVTADEISAATALDGTRVLALLTALELDGCIRREAHGRFRTGATGC